MISTHTNPNCPFCAANTPQDARFCPQCGRPLPEFSAPDPTETAAREAAPTLPWFWITLGGSVLLTLVLTLVFHLPIFILGAFLPLFWPKKRT